MKKIFRTIMAVAIAALTFTACEDVPAPYENPNGQGTKDPVEGEYINETFASNFGEFTVHTVTGTPWVIDFGTAKASGYDNSSQVTTPSESYLVSPMIDLSNSKGAHIEFEYILRYITNYGTADPSKIVSVLITDAYTGDPTTTNWENITGTLTEGRDWSTFSDYSYNIGESYIGKPDVRVALYYKCGDDSPTWEVKNLKVLEGTAGENPDTPQQGEGDGTEASPYNVTAAIAKGAASGVFVKGYIVGYVSGVSYDQGAVFSADTCTVMTNLLIAASATETAAANCMPVQLPAGEVREALNLVQNKANLGQEVTLYGNIENYFRVPGVKTVTYAKIGDKEVGTKPSQGGEGEYLNESFSSSFGKFNVSTVKGTPWVIDFGTAKASGYDNASKVTTPSESYLVSPAIDLTSAKAVSVEFDYILRYVTNNGEPVGGVNNKVLITDNYTGNPATTEWTDITGTLTEGRDWTTFSKYSAAVPAKFIGKSGVVIALYYSCDSSSGTWEVKNLVVAEGEPGGGDNPGGGEESGDTFVADLSTFGYENAVDVENVNLSDGTVLTFAQEGGNNHPKYYNATKGVRMYALNSLTVKASGKAIVGIKLQCDSYNGTDYVGNPQLYAEAGSTKVKPNVSGTTVTFSGLSGNSVKIVNDWTGNSGGTQLRVKVVEITYAE